MELLFSSFIGTILLHQWVVGIGMKRLISSAAVLAALVLPVAASADAPNHAAPSGHQTIQGVIRSIDGKYGLTVRVGQGLLDSVTTRQGTIINPTGLQLQPGMRVAIAGHADGDTFEADRIVGSPFTENIPGSTASSTPTLWPELIPNGTFQTHGPSAVGGG
jgi:hypothetical protein